MSGSSLVLFVAEDARSGRIVDDVVQDLHVLGVLGRVSADEDSILHGGWIDAVHDTVSNPLRRADQVFGGRPVDDDAARRLAIQVDLEPSDDRLVHRVVHREPDHAVCGAADACGRPKDRARSGAPARPVVGHTASDNQQRRAGGRGPGVSRVKVHGIARLQRLGARPSAHPGTMLPGLAQGAGIGILSVRLVDVVAPPRPRPCRRQKNDRG